MTVEIAADITARAVQSSVMERLGRNRPVNSLRPAREPGRRVRDDGILYRNDAQYGATYPNSFLDIWYPDEDLSRPRPVLVYFHGGGFLFGDKVMGDPLATDSADGLLSSIGGFLDDGFAVVCPEYAFAPDYRFPVQVRQVDEVLSHLHANREEYALDTERIVLMGGSAGASLTEIYGLVVADAPYAAELGIRPSIELGQVRGLIIDEAALTSRGVTDSNMRLLFQVWLGEEDLDEGTYARQIDVPSHIRDFYPPAFINTSNLESWFVRSASDLREALERRGLPHEFFFAPRSVEELEHGFVNRHATSDVAADCYAKMRAFAREVVSNR